MSDTEDVTRLRTQIGYYQLQLNVYEVDVNNLQTQLRAYEQPDTVSENAAAPTKSGHITPVTFHGWHSSHSISNSPKDRQNSSESQSSGIEFIPYRLVKPDDANKKGNYDFASRQPPRKRAQAPRWIAAGLRILKNIENIHSGILFLSLQSLGGLVQQGSPLERGLRLATKVKSVLHNAAGTTGRTELFFFLSALRILERCEVLSLEESAQCMNILGSQTMDFRHRRSVLLGVDWFHQKIILGLRQKSWGIEHAIAVVALISPNATSQYDHVRHRDNELLFLKALQGVKDSCKCVEHIGELFFEYVKAWEPSMSKNKISDRLYSKVPSMSLQASRAVVQLNQDSAPPFLRPDELLRAYPASVSPDITLVMADQRYKLPASSSFDSSNLLLDLLRVLAQEGFVEYSLLVYASTKRKRWAACGELEDFSLKDIGTEDTIIDTLRDNKKLDHELDILKSQGLIELDERRIHLLHNFVVKWRQWRQASHLLCFYFTGCEYSDKFSAVGNLALPSFQNFIRAYRQQPEHHRHALGRLVLPAIIQASKFSNLAWKKECICTLDSEGLQEMDHYTQASFAVRKAYVLRSDGRWNESSQVIREQLQFLGTEPRDPRLNAVRGLLIHSLASNMWERERFDEASATWGQWQPPAADHITLFETRVSTRILMGTGKAMLHQGNFQGARASLESALRQYHEDLHPHLDVLATLSDVYCELGDPLRAKILLRPFIERNKDHTNRYYRNCYISYAESLILTRNYEEAEKLLMTLKDYLRTRTQLDRHDERRHIRVMIQLAQNLHYQADNTAQWKETVARWNDVIASMKQFDEVSSWDLGVIFISMHHATLQSGTEDSKWLHDGINELGNRGRFWMRGIGTYWWKHIRAQLPHIDTESQMPSQSI